MDSEPSFDTLVTPLRGDVRSGASAIAGRAARLLGGVARTRAAGSAAELRRDLGALARLFIDAQPSMAPLVTLAREVLLACEDVTALQDVRERGAGAAESFARRLEAATQAVALAAHDLLPGRRVATVSASATVRAALLHAARAKELRVLCFESRPSREGRALATSLAERGVEVEYAADAAMGALIGSCDLALIGADSVGDAGLVNKIGSALLIIAAREAGVPVHALADTTKLLPVGWPQRLDDDRPGAEVWADPPPGVRVWNRYFEAVPVEGLRGLVTERGVLDASAISRARRELRVPEALSGPPPSRP